MLHISRQRRRNRQLTKRHLHRSPRAPLDDSEKAARTKLQALLEQHEGSRDDIFVKQGQAFGGESGEDSDGKKVPKKGAKGAAKKGTTAATPAAEFRVARFDSRDADHDGKISWEEFLASAADQKGAKERFEKYDSNKNGTITRDEFMK